MKFYVDKDFWNLWSKIINNKLTAILSDYYNDVLFYKNGLKHNVKNTSYIALNQSTPFYLNGEYYGNENTFTKSSWRKFAKLQAFL